MNIKDCKEGKTYFVEGFNEKPFWYLFRCEEISDSVIIGSDIKDSEGNTFHNWQMKLYTDSKVRQTVTEMTLEEFRYQKPEEFL